MWAYPQSTRPTAYEHAFFTACAAEFLGIAPGQLEQHYAAIVRLMAAVAKYHRPYILQSLARQVGYFQHPGRQGFSREWGEQLKTGPQGHESSHVLRAAF